MLKNNRPFLIKAFNRLNIRVRLEADDLMQTAKRKTGLTDFGEANLQEPLHQLITSIHQDANLHAFGQFITKQRLLNILQNRLRIEQCFKDHPDIEDIEINCPIFITGLQRTGTTRLHRLLAAHPDVRSLTSWEALNPAPLNNDSNNQKRINQAKTAERALRFMSPDFFAIHPVEHEAPEEDVLINDMTFVSAVPEATMHVPGYTDWLKTADGLWPYSYLKKVLKLLSWQHPNKKWVLKTPQHLENMAPIFAVFPDAKVIHTYRDPLKVIPSFSSMLYQSFRIFSDQVNAAAIANHWLQKDAKMIAAAMAYWSGLPSGKVLDVSYYSMMKNPEKELKKIVGFMDLDWNTNAMNSINTINTQNKQHKYGKHQYHLADFGLTKETVEALFVDYRKKYAIPLE